MSQNLINRSLRNRRLLHGVVKSLYTLARLRRSETRANSLVPRRVVHISPCYFSDRSYIGGGERYAMSLAEAMSEQIETVFVTFGDVRDTFMQGRLRVEVYPAIETINGVPFDPLSYGFLRELKSADVVHCHQYKTVVTNLAILACAALRKRVFVTDLGGASCHFADTIPIADHVDAFLHISAFGAKMLTQTRAERAQVIYGGVDARFLEEKANGERERKALFVGRLLPHKGINYLIEGMSGDTPLEVIGRPYSSDYFDLLRQLAEGKQVRFNTNASDEDLINAYRHATVTVLPSVYEDVYGTQQPMPELLGLVLLESMACGTPVICTDVGGMPEYVAHGVTGFIVPPNDPAALGERVSYLLDNPDIAMSMGRKGREGVLAEFTWKAVAERCLRAYCN